MLTSMLRTQKDYNFSNSVCGENIPNSLSFEISLETSDPFPEPSSRSQTFRRSRGPSWDGEGQDQVSEGGQDSQVGSTSRSTGRVPSVSSAGPLVIL